LIAPWPSRCRRICTWDLPPAEHARAADLLGPNRARRPPAAAAAADSHAAAGESVADAAPDAQRSLHRLALENPLIRPYADACSAPWRAAELAASNGHASARALARLYAALMAGADGQLILAPGTVAALAEQQVGRTPDLVLGYPMRRGRGVNLNTAGEFGPAAEAFGHTGAGGSLAFADPRHGLGVGYVMNQLWGGTGPGSRGRKLVASVYRCLRELS
jgi:CubicO group peptidase (beta-lactamase class C family)